MWEQPVHHDDRDEEGLLRMSVWAHLDELRSRIIKAVLGWAVAFALCVGFSIDLWRVVSAPAFDALVKIGIRNPKLVITAPMESFTIIWMYVPLVVSLFVASPWVLYQIWAFIAPGLYPRERRWAVPFVMTTAGLFILGGLFAYFIAFRYGLVFLLGMALSGGVEPMVTISSYFDTFMEVMLGVSLVFEMPVLIFFLTLLRVVSPQWLLSHSRYAILAIVTLAAIITPSPDALNLMLFAIPMVALYFVGVFAGYLLVLNREGRRLPWAKILPVILLLLLIAGGAVWLMINRYHFRFIRHWPFLTK